MLNECIHLALSLSLSSSWSFFFNFFRLETLPSLESQVLLSGITSSVSKKVGCQRIQTKSKSVLVRVSDPLSESTCLPPVGVPPSKIGWLVLRLLSEWHFPFSITSFPSPSMLIPTSNRVFLFSPPLLLSLDSTPIHLNTILGQSLQSRTQVSTLLKVLLSRRLEILHLYTSQLELLPRSPLQPKVRPSQLWALGTTLKTLLLLTRGSVVATILQTSTLWTTTTLLDGLVLEEVTPRENQHL